MLLAVGTFVWPALLHPRTSVGGREFSEVWGHLWAQWIFPHMVLVRNAWPFIIDIVNLPEGWALCPADPFHLLVVTLFRSALGLVAAYNVLMIGAIVATVWATYRLAYELCRVKAMAVAAGIMVGLSPYVRASYIDNYTESMGVYWIALVFLNLAVNCRRPSLKRGVGGGLLFACMFYTNMYYTVISGIGYVIASGWAIMFEHHRRRRLALALSVAPFLGLLLAIPWVLVFSQTETSHVPGNEGMVQFVNDATLPLAAPADHEISHALEIAIESAAPRTDWFQHPGSADIAAYLPPSRGSQLAHPRGLICGVYCGVLAPICLIAFFGVRRRRIGGFVLVALVAWFLSLGVFPCWRGNPLSFDGIHPVSGPYYLFLRVVPFVTGLTQTYRFSVVLSVLSACGAAVAAGVLWQKNGYGKWLGMLLMGLCLADTLLLGGVPYPTPTVDTSVNPAFEWIAMRDDEKLVIEWPYWIESFGCGGNVIAAMKPEYHQTVHTHPLGPWTDMGSLEWMWIGPEFFRDLSALTSMSESPPEFPPADELGASDSPPDERSRMISENYGYFVAHMWALPDQERQAVRRYLTAYFGDPKPFPGVDVYGVDPNLPVNMPSH
jgi:hypothetical protein